MNDKRDLDGPLKNLSVVAGEWVEYFRSLIEHAKRLRYVTLPFQKTRVPEEKIAEGYPDNNEILHLLTGVISLTWQSLDRNLTYLTIVLIVTEWMGWTNLFNLIPKSWTE